MLRPRVASLVDIYSAVIIATCCILIFYQVFDFFIVDCSLRCWPMLYFVHQVHCWGHSLEKNWHTDTARCTHYCKPGYANHLISKSDGVGTMSPCFSCTGYPGTPSSTGTHEYTLYTRITGLGSPRFTAVRAVSCSFLAQEAFSCSL